MYDHVKSINSVTTTMHEDTVKNVLLTDVRYYLLMYVLEESHCPCRQGPVYKSLSVSSDFKSLSSSPKSLSLSLKLKFLTTSQIIIILLLLLLDYVQ